MADSLFDDNEPDYLEELTKPGGKFDKTKYTSVEEMYKAIAKGKVLADRTLDHKNSEFDELREDFLKVTAENNTKDKLDELMRKLEARGTEDKTSTQVTDVTPSIDPSKIKELAAQQFLEMEAARKDASNMEKVESRLRERFGENASKILKDKMNALSLSTDDLKFLAKKSPEAVFNALGLNQQTSNDQVLPRSSTRSDSFAPTNTLRDAVYYEDLRRKSPKEYFSEKTSIQRLKDMDHPDFLTRYNQRA